MKPFLLILLSVFLLQSCKPRQNRIVKRNGKKDLISFASVFGIPYTEVSRRTSKGLSFNDAGYQLQPQWQITFLSNDSAAIFSPFKNKTINFPLTCGYDSIFNTARTWFKVKKLNKDSLKAELLTSNGDSLDTKGAEVYLTFYSDNYIKNTLGKNAAILRHPSKADSAYIKQLSRVANTDITKSFAATQPVQLFSKSKMLSVKKEVTEGTLFNNFDTSDDYLNPTYDIVINKAYDNFFVYFTIVIDKAGKMHFGKPSIPAGEVYRDRCKNVMDGYLKYYLKVTPGNTLGIVHASEITVKCTGKKSLMSNRISKL